MAKKNEAHVVDEHNKVSRFFQCAFGALWLVCLASALGVVYSTFMTYQVSTN